MSVPTYYVPSGQEHLIQTSNDEAEEVVVARALRGDHVHTWSKDTGTMCVDGLETSESGAQVPRLTKVERGKPCKLGNKETFK